MKTIKVAWGMTNSQNAQIEDPQGKLGLRQFDGELMYTDYSFETQAEVDAFKLAVDEMDCYLTGYIIQI